jgi:hypothetical protein
MNELFKVDNVTLKTRIAPDGTFYDVYEVQFTTHEGIKSKTDIKKEQFTPEFVRRTLESISKDLDAVKKL